MEWKRLSQASEVSQKRRMRKKMEGKGGEAERTQTTTHNMEDDSEDRGMKIKKEVAEDDKHIRQTKAKKIRTSPQNVCTRVRVVYIQ